MDSLVHELTGSSVEELQENQRHGKSRNAAPHILQSPETSMQRDGNSDGRSDESMGDGDLVLKSKHKIFLSHSGAQKDFVEYLCVQELGNTKRRNQWFSVWKEWAKIDSRINIDEWKQSVEVLISFNGIEYNQNSEGIDAYLKCVVSNICKEVVPDIKWDDSHVQGRSNICKVIKDKIQQIQGLNKDKVCILGFYGEGGIGETTICNELFQEFHGKVSHVELGSESPKELLRGALKDLRNTSQELLQQLNKGEIQT